MDPRMLMREKDEELAECQRLLEDAIKENRELTAEEQRDYDKHKRRAVNLDSLITETLAIQNMRAGIPPNQPPVGEQQSGPSGAAGREKAIGNEYRSTTGPFQTFGEQLLSIMRAGSPGESEDPRLHEIRQAGLGESVPSLGGYLVQSDFIGEIIRQIYSTGYLAARCRKFTIGENFNGVKIPAVDESSREDLSLSVTQLVVLCVKNDCGAKQIR